MVFNSLEFAVLLAVLIALWRATRGRAQLAVMLGFSYLFYAGWNPWFCGLLLMSTLVDWWVAGRLHTTEHAPRRRLLLATSLVCNLGVLVYFKYGSWLLALLGLAAYPDADAAAFGARTGLPPGISFYTFQTLSYTIDVYRRRTKPADSLLEFMLYVAFFPQLVAGPILRASEFFPQLRQRSTSPAQTLQALELLGVGLFKKVVLADNIGAAVDTVFANPSAYGGASIALAALMFWVQVYCDFSGYSTMARGLGKLFGFQLPRNFDFPLLATNPLEYRRGWHITMSRWFRDYVFHPLGGTRVSAPRIALNIMIVWALFGLWHGAAWTFIGWGLYNGLVQVTYRELLRRGLTPPEFRGKRFAGLLLNLTLCTLSAVVFRSEDLAGGLEGLQRVLTLQDGRHMSAWWAAAMLAYFLLHAASRRYYREDTLRQVGWTTRWTLVAGWTLLMVFAAPAGRPFVYFQF